MRLCSNYSCDIFAGLKPPRKTQKYGDLVPTICLFYGIVYMTLSLARFVPINILYIVCQDIGVTQHFILHGDVSQSKDQSNTLPSTSTQGVTLRCLEPLVCTTENSNDIHNTEHITSQTG